MTDNDLALLLPLLLHPLLLLLWVCFRFLGYLWNPLSWAMEVAALLAIILLDYADFALVRTAKPYSWAHTV